MRKISRRVFACGVAVVVLIIICGIWSGEQSTGRQKLLATKPERRKQHFVKPTPSRPVGKRFSLRGLSRLKCNISASHQKRVDKQEEFWNSNYEISQLQYFVKSCLNGCALLHFGGTQPSPDESDIPTFADLERKFGDYLEPGGVYRPSRAECIEPQRVVLIVPYRNRDAQLRLFLHFAHSFMRAQQVVYRIVIAEQDAGTSFNRGLLFNAAFRELRRLVGEDATDCLILHDVDMQPVDYRTLYHCHSSHVVHLAERVDKLMQPEHGVLSDLPTWEEIAASNDTWHSSWPNYFGGVLAITAGHFETVNGFSNAYFGWGAEDDDLLRRVTARRIPVLRYPDGVNRFRTLRRDHIAAAPNADRFRVFHEVTHAFAPDGLVDVAQFYEAQMDTSSILFTHVRVSVKEQSLRTRWYLPLAFEKADTTRSNKT